MTVKSNKKYKNEFSPEQRMWINALQSGKYKKATGMLIKLTKTDKPKGYCCLGVYCAITNVKLRIVQRSSENNKGFFGGQDTELTIIQMRKLKLRGQLGDFDGTINFNVNRVKKEIDSLANLNDITHMSIAQIGKWIEKNPHKVFKNFTDGK